MKRIYFVNDDMVDLFSCDSNQKLCDFTADEIIGSLYSFRNEPPKCFKSFIFYRILRKKPFYENAC